MPAENKYSIIVPSFNRLDEIKELVAAFRNLKFDPSRYELIIIDDGSTDQTIPYLAEVFKDINNYHYFTQQNQGPGAARNTGMQKAGGNFFIFIDSDCTVPENWLDEIDKAVSKENADAFGGPDTFRDDFPPLLKAINYSMTSFITTGGLRGKKGKKLAKFYPRSFNMGLSRNLWEKIGGFGGLRHGQDIEFSHRIIRSGAQVVFVENAPVYHKRRTSIRRFYKQVFNWGVARINLSVIDPAMLEPLHALPAVFTLLVGIFFIMTLLISALHPLFIGGLVFGVLILLFLMIDAALKYKQVKPALLLPVIIPAQVFGYGAGFIYNFIRRKILKKGESAGFKRNYYK